MACPVHVSRMNCAASPALSRWAIQPTTYTSINAANPRVFFFYDEVHLSELGDIQ